MTDDKPAPSVSQAVCEGPSRGAQGIVTGQKSGFD